MIFHLLDHLELIVVTGAFLLELFLFSLVCLLFFVFDVLLRAVGGELLFYLLVQLFEVDLFVGVYLLVVFGDLEVVVDLYLLGGFWLVAVVLLGAAVA
jgi:hypothetical protein